MIINFSELSVPFHRLAPGAVLISPDDVRYLKSIPAVPKKLWSDLDLVNELINEY